MLSVLNALTLSALLTLLSSGLALIFGLRNIMNFAHGGLYMVGAYLGFSIGQHTGFWLALVIVPVVLGVVGVVLEFGVIRPLHKRSELEIALVTYGISLIIGQVIIKVYGGDTKAVGAPSGLGSTVDVLGVRYPTYRLFIIAVGLGTVAAIYLWLKFTRTGLYIRAVSRDRATAQMVGVDTKRVGLLVVCLSTAFAGIAGVLAGPYIAVQPGMGDAIMINSLLIVAIGGLGSIGGAIAASVLFGVASSVGAEYIPSVAALLPFALLLVVLAMRPQGIGGMREAT